jgi:hypothetical protein
MSSKLVLDYRPSEYTGWEWGKTLGGHHAAQQFTRADHTYRISLLAFGQHSPDPVYEPVPGDATIAYRRTLERQFGAHYTFRYGGGLRGTLRVQCYSVFARQASFGAQLYVVLDGDPAAQAQLKWIQVTHWTGTASPSAASYVDNTQCPNPFFISGGLVSVHGTPVFNFDNPVTVPAPSGVLAARYQAETFLAWDTLSKDAAGKDVIEIFAGVKYGWELREVSS